MVSIPMVMSTPARNGQPENPANMSRHIPRPIHARPTEILAMRFTVTGLLTYPAWPGDGILTVTGSLRRVNSGMPPRYSSAAVWFSTVTSRLDANLAGRCWRERPFHDRKGSVTWEPPIGIEPMTYALRGGFEASSAVHRVTLTLLVRLPCPIASRVIQSWC